MTRRRRVYAVLTTLVGLFTVYEIVTSFVAYTADAYVQSDLVKVAPRVTGQIVDVHVTDNQDVTEGDLLASIDPVPFRLDVDERSAELAAARARVTGDEDLITTARDDLAAATSAAAYAHDTQARLAALASAQDVSRAALDGANDALRRANDMLGAAREAVERAQSTTAMHRAEQVRAAAALAVAEWRLARTALVSPATGTVTNLTVRVGDTAQADVPLIGIVDAHAWRIVGNFKENYIRAFAPGDAAWVWLDSQPWHLHRARVTSVARGISRNPDAERLLAYVAPTTDWIRLQRRFPVTLHLDDEKLSNTLHMGADARVLIVP